MAGAVDPESEASAVQTTESIGASPPGVERLGVDVFISYSSRDKAIADAMCATLESRRTRCWIAPRDILPGAMWAESIIGGINNCRVFVLVYSPHSNTSNQVIREVERAVSKGIPILPFRISDAPLSKGMEYCISSSHWLDAMTPPLEKHLRLLADTVGTLLDQASRSSTPAASDRPVNETQPRSILLGLADDRVQEVVPRGVSLPFTTIDDTFHVMKAEKPFVIRIPIFEGRHRGPLLPVGFLNTRVGELQLEYPADIGGQITIQVQATPYDEVEFGAWFKDATETELSVTFARVTPARTQMHVFDRLTRLSRDKAHHEAIKKLIKKGRSLGALASRHVEGDQSEVHTQLVTQGRKLISAIERLERSHPAADLLMNWPVPQPLPADSSGRVVCPLCRKATYRMAAPSGDRLFDCSRCKGNFWYGTDAPGPEFHLRFAVQDALRAGDSGLVEQAAKLAMKSPDPVMQPAVRDAIRARAISLTITASEVLDPVMTQINEITANPTSARTILPRLRDDLDQAGQQLQEGHDLLIRGRELMGDDPADQTPLQTLEFMQQQIGTLAGAVGQMCGP